MEEREFFVEDNKPIRDINPMGKLIYPWYFSIPWIILNIFVGSLLSMIVFAFGRSEYKRGKTGNGFKIAGFICLVVSWFFTFSFLSSL